MFILRRITSEGKRMNLCIGEIYEDILKETDKEDFKKICESMKWSDNDPDLYGFVSYNTPKGNINHPLYKKSTYFIMTETGKTFADLTLKTII
jgi:hypothetical protein